jgi:hypothetical protein
MAWAVPRYSKKKVNRAGQQLAVPSPYEEWGPTSDQYYDWLNNYVDALDIINNWRSSHNFPLNTFHIGLRRRAQIIDQMQDIGGCRAIVANATDVSKLFESYSESDIKHTLHQCDNYIDTPKDSGYRGVHLVYRYYSDKKQDYNTLKIEMQLRSQLQHAWATAVETVGAFVQQALIE